jgi:hypothetical protein
LNKDSEIMNCISWNLTEKKSFLIIWPHHNLVLCFKWMKRQFERAWRKVHKSQFPLVFCETLKFSVEKWFVFPCWNPWMNPCVDSAKSFFLNYAREVAGKLTKYWFSIFLGWHIDWVHVLCSLFSVSRSDRNGHSVPISWRKHGHHNVTCPNMNGSNFLMIWYYSENQLNW